MRERQPQNTYLQVLVTAAALRHDPLRCNIKRGRKNKWGMSDRAVLSQNFLPKVEKEKIE